MNETEKIKALLSSSKINDRRKAVKSVIKSNYKGLGLELYNLYLIEKEKNKSWEIQSELIECFGLLKYMPSLNDVELISKANIEHDMITIKASGCLLRLTRNSLVDVLPIKNVFDYGKYSVVHGTLMTMGVDKMYFTDDETEYIIKFVNQINYKGDKGYSDLRTGLANACAGWIKNEVVNNFLNSCLAPNTVLNNVASKSLEGKYSY